jgi:hypothetical protein
MSTLYLIATPIGNLEDITLRAMRVLGEVDALACEDTRRTRILFEKHGIRSPPIVFSYREQNEGQAGRRILGFIGEVKSVGVCSDAGYRIVAEAVERGVALEVVPGAGAVSVALLSSGLPRPAIRSRDSRCAKAAPAGVSWRWSGTCPTPSCSSNRLSASAPCWRSASPACARPHRGERHRAGFPRGTLTRAG